MLYLKTSERCPVSSRPEPITMVTRVYSCTPASDGTESRRSEDSSFIRAMLQWLIDINVYVPFTFSRSRSH